MKYRPEIDGLRAIAVIPVILFHLSPALFPSGFIGVDIFFVISGFLITSLVLKEQTKGNFSFKDFWIRRIKRLFPAMATVLIATLIAGYFLLFENEFKSLAAQTIAVLLMLANIKMWKMSDYWAPAAEEIPLLHTWSLGVEEQFYVLYVLLLVFILKFSKKHLLPIISLLFIISFSLCIYSASRYPDANWYFLHTRAWELLAGAIVAILLQKNIYIPKYFSLVGLIGIAISYIIIDKTFLFPSGITILPILATACFIFASHQNRLLTLSPIVYIGKISYPLYLWHWPIIVFYHNVIYPSKLGWTDIVYILLLTFFCSITSYHFIENPIRRSRYKYTSKLIFTVLILVFCVSFAIKKDFIVNTDNSTYTAGHNSQQKYELVHHWKDGPLIFGKDSPQVVLIGSSHARMYAPIIHEICEELNISSAYFTASGTSAPFVSEFYDPKNVKIGGNDRSEYDEIKRKNLALWKPNIIITIDRYEEFFSDPNIEQIYKLYFSELNKYSSNIITLEQIPIAGTASNLLLNLERNKFKNNSMSEHPKHTKVRNLAHKVINNLCKEYDIDFIKTQDLFLNSDGKVIFADKNNVTYYKDDDHLNDHGARLVKSRLKAAILRALKKAPAEYASP
ncbi:acyltransferase family protein [Lentisphaera profundi]|uniref:Acyltransferase family protein n=1 Tax=Lentisphaera profundi TaxID=1658616 RepID=A0ABY7VVF5_9BACT|nr:acyltransferase family protein [Lentisphaera profundi]WDE98208.1 acyltransferase family protein [Lentisphaera profundi]